MPSEPSGSVAAGQLSEIVRTPLAGIAEEIAAVTSIQVRRMGRDVQALLEGDEVEPQEQRE